MVTPRVYHIPFYHYSKGYTIYAINLEPDIQLENNEMWPSPKKGNLRVEVRFAKALPENVTLVVVLHTGGIQSLLGAQTLNKATLTSWCLASRNGTALSNSNELNVENMSQQ